MYERPLMCMYSRACALVCHCAQMYADTRTQVFVHVYALLQTHACLCMYLEYM
jgi:hypothetical protein